jgi:hypothetical protein
VAGCCEHSNELSSCIKCGKFLDQLRKYQLLMKPPCCLELGSISIRKFYTTNGLWNGTGVLYICDFQCSNNCLSHKKGAHTHIVHAHIHKPTCNNSFFLSLPYGMIHKGCVGLPSIFLPIKDDNNKTWNLKDPCVCVCVYMCVHDTHTHSAFCKNPLCWVLSPWDVMLCHWVNSSWHFKGSYCLSKISSH